MVFVNVNYGTQRLDFDWIAWLCLLRQPSTKIILCCTFCSVVLAFQHKGFVHMFASQSCWPQAQPSFLHWASDWNGWAMEAPKGLHRKLLSQRLVHYERRLQVLSSEPPHVFSLLLICTFTLNTWTRPELHISLPFRFFVELEITKEGCSTEKQERGI